MAITLRSTSSLAYVSRTNTTVTAPAGATTGDVIVVSLVSGTATGPPALTPPAGWTQIAASGGYGDSSVFTVSVSMWAKPYDGASSWTWTHATASTQAVVAAYVGVDTTTMQDVAATTAFSNAASGSGAIAPSLTTVTPGAHLVIARGSWDGVAITPPTGWTGLYDAPILWVGETDQATAGATGAVTVPNGDSGDNYWGIVMAALRPGASGNNWTQTPTDDSGTTDLPTVIPDPSGLVVREISITVSG